jgi:hypothetical protein
MLAAFCRLSWSLWAIGSLSPERKRLPCNVFAFVTTIEQKQAKNEI